MSPCFVSFFFGGGGGGAWGSESLSQVFRTEQLILGLARAQIPTKRGIMYYMYAKSYENTEFQGFFRFPSAGIWKP